MGHRRFDSTLLDILMLAFTSAAASGNAGLNHRIYCMTTRDFISFTPTRLFFAPGFSVIDATMVQAGGKYRLVFKDETLRPVRKHLRVASGDSIEGPFRELSEPFARFWVEGQTVLRIGDECIVHYDQYTSRTYGAMRSQGLRTWENVSDQLSLLSGTRHGTAFEVCREVLAGLIHYQPDKKPAGAR